MHGLIDRHARLRRCWIHLVAGRKTDLRSRFEAGRIDWSQCPLPAGGQVPVAALQKLAWEETIFGRPCWQLHLALPPQDLAGLRAAAAKIRAPGIVWTRVASEHAHVLRALSAAGFEPLLEMTNLDMPLAKWRPPLMKTDVKIRRATARDAGAVGRMAARIFSKDRFHVDPKIAPRLADRAHQEWARNSVLGKAADVTLVSVKDGRISGFHALKWLETPQGCVGLTVLIGIAATHRGQGVGRALLLAGLVALQRDGARQAWVRTESANAAASLLYQSEGFRSRLQFWYLRKFNS